MENLNIVELIDEEGDAYQFEFIMSIDYDDLEYAILAPLDEEGPGDEIVILRLELDENDEEVYVNIEDEDELDEIFDAFCEIVSQNDGELH